MAINTFKHNKTSYLKLGATIGISLFILLMASRWASASSDTYSSSILGFNRLLYVYGDRFNNTIYMPLDADIANITTINLNVSVAVDALNGNMSTINIQGTAGYYTPLNNYFIPLTDNSIYIYYDNNVNYVNYSPISDPVNSILCTFSTHGFPGACTLSNPVMYGETPNSDVVMFEPAYNSIGECAPRTTVIANVPNDCNIYGNDGMHTISQTCGSRSINGNNYPQVCVPIFANGTGMCTTQIGLMSDNVHTNSQGKFSLSTTICGTGNANLIFDFYGYPSPQPVSASLPLLGYSAGQGAASGNLYPATFNALNYHWSPAHAAQGVSLGLFLLDYGQITALSLVFVLATIGIILYLARQR